MAELKEANRKLDEPSNQEADVSSKSRVTESVYYDGGCPICRLEVDFYQQVDTVGHIEWIDITELRDEQLPRGKSREQLLSIFHARTSGDNWVTGVDAFAVIWSRLPRFRWFAWVFHSPMLRQVAQVFYRGFLAWQRRDRARRQRISGKSHAASS
ncbi:MAG: thiol-disulfide oxidoreductase DCC family protein [Rhizobiaceae bacterium]